MRSGRQSRKHQREEDSSPANGNSKRHCVNNDGLSTSSGGMSNMDNTHSGKYCVTFFVFKKKKFPEYTLTYERRNRKKKKEENKLGSGVRLQGTYHTTLVFDLNENV